MRNNKDKLFWQAVSTRNVEDIARCMYGGDQMTRNRNTSAEVIKRCIEREQQAQRKMTTELFTTQSLTDVRMLKRAIQESNSKLTNLKKTLRSLERYA